MRTGVVVAPGKLVILGEYAVVDGAPAIVAAVHRGVRCTVSEGAGVRAPGDTRFVDAALVGAPTACFTFEDEAPVVDLPSKPGFGGSAAATVAAVVAAGLPPERAYEAHAAVQGGGSGIDVFASLHGGVRRFRDGAEMPILPMLAVWSGASAQTGPRVAQYRAWSGREAFVTASAALVAAYPSDPVAALAEAYRLLTSMAASAGLDYDRPAFQTLARLARDHGGACKPSGAGGGDIAVAHFPDPDARAAFAAAASAAGLAPISVNVAGPAAWLPTFPNAPDRS